MTKSGGNAATNAGITIYATYCENKENKELEPIFITDLPYLKNSDMKFEWKSFDTVLIRYNNELRIFKQEPESKTIKPKIIFEYLAE